MSGTCHSGLANPQPHKCPAPTGANWGDKMREDRQTDGVLQKVHTGGNTRPGGRGGGLLDTHPPNNRRQPALTSGFGTDPKSRLSTLRGQGEGSPHDCLPYGAKGRGGGGAWKPPPEILTPPAPRRVGHTPVAMPHSVIGSGRIAREEGPGKSP